MGRTNQLTAVAGAVLAGGASTRMGTDKAFMRLKGEALAPRMAQVLEDGGCNPVVLVGKQPGLKRFSWNVLDQECGPKHPLSGILHALRYFQPLPVLFCAVDMPGVEPLHIRRLLNFQGACVAASAEDGHSLLCLLDSLHISKAEKIVRQHGSAQDLFAGLARIVLPKTALSNCNTPQDWTRLGLTLG